MSEPSVLVDIHFSQAPEDAARGRQAMIERWEIVEHAGGHSIRHRAAGWVMQCGAVKEWDTRELALAWVTELVDSPAPPGSVMLSGVRR